MLEWVARGWRSGRYCRCPRSNRRRPVLVLRFQQVRHGSLPLSTDRVLPTICHDQRDDHHSPRGEEPAADRTVPGKSTRRLGILIHDFRGHPQRNDEQSRRNHKTQPAAIVPARVQSQQPTFRSHVGQKPERGGRSRSPGNEWHPNARLRASRNAVLIPRQWHNRPLRSREPIVAVQHSRVWQSGRELDSTYS